MAALVTAAVGGCAEPERLPSEPTIPPSASSDHPHITREDSESPQAEQLELDGGLPSDHVHGVAVNPADGLVYLATHDGLFRYGAGGPEPVGPVVDLMGFTVAGPDHFYASGHPGPGVDLPQPLGLAESRDGGLTWTPVSRGGQSDFHALTASAAGVLGFDGFALRATGDGLTWTDVETAPETPFDMATSPTGSTVLITSASGVYRSQDGGSSWAQPAAPLLQFVAFADENVAVGVTPHGEVSRSEDAGATWTRTAQLEEPVMAVAATRRADGSVHVVMVTASGLLASDDGGVTFAPLLAAS